MPLAMNEYQLTLTGSGEVTINWGDGTTNIVVLTSAPQVLKHAYSTVDRFLIQISGPGTVTKAEAVGTEKSTLEEIRSFGELGLTDFRHKLQVVDQEWELTESFLKDVPETIPSSLKSLPGLFSNAVQPPVSKLGSWDWTNIEDLSGFFNNASDFDFTWQSKKLPNLKNLTNFAIDAKRATFYIDDVELSNPELTVGYMFGSARNCEINFHRVVAHSNQVRNILQGAYDITLNWTDVSFPVAADINNMINYCTGMRISINGLNLPQATSATSAFALGGSIFGRSNNPEDNAKLIVTRLNCPNLTNAENMFSGWTHAELNLILPDLSNVTNMTGFLSFTVDSTVKVSGFKTANIDGQLELVTHSYNSEFQFNQMVFGAGSNVTNCFYTNTNCGIEINGLDIANNARVSNIFLASKACQIKIPNATIGSNTNLVGLFSNLSQGSKIDANNWVFHGNTDITQMFSALSESTVVTANDWLFQGNVIGSRLFSLNQPVITDYTGKKAGGVTVTANNWIFNGVAQLEDYSNFGTIGGILSATDNGVYNLNNWEFNNTASVQLGIRLRSSLVNMQSWQFNSNVNLSHFGSDVGFGNLSDFTIDLTGWQFTEGANTVVDNIFADFAKRAPGIFGDKPNHPTTVIGLNTWPVGIYDSATDAIIRAGQDVVGLELNMFS